MKPERYPIRLTRIGLAMLAILMGACSLQGGDDSEPSKLNASRLLWERQQDRDYDYVLTRSCYCAFFGAYTVSVRADTVQGAVSEETDAAVPLEQLPYFLTIDDLFDVVATAMKDADRLDVEYDPERGFPTRIDIDYLKNAIDDEIVYQAGNFRSVD